MTGLHAALTARLDEIGQRAAGATEGPWWATEDLETGEDAAVGVAAGPYDGYRSLVVMTPGAAHFDCGEDTDREADADFIAAARTDVPALVAALRAVVDLHRQDESVRMVDAGPGRITVLVDRCAECFESGWPCPTVRALAAALGVSP